MFREAFVLCVCLVVCLGCFVGLYHLQAETPIAPRPPTPQEREVAEPQRDMRFVSEPETTDINSDFYQTIIRNNLFAPLGTDLHKKPVPGASVKLIATFTRQDPVSEAEAIVENIATGEQKTVGVGDTIAGYSVRDIQAKQILLEKQGARAVWKRMSHPFLLN